MNRVVVNDTEYAVKFGRELVTKPSGRVTGIITWCDILAGPVGSLDKDKERISCGHAMKHKRDTDNAVVARTVALDRALCGLAPSTRRQVSKGVTIRRKRTVWINDTDVAV